MTWSYRIIKHDKNRTVSYALHEVFYDTKGNIEAWTEDPITVSGDSKKEVIKAVHTILEDIKRLPVLKESELDKV